MHRLIPIALSLSVLLTACEPNENEPATTIITPSLGTAEFRDCDDCPIMVVIPDGSFLMGTAEADRQIDPRTGKPATNDSPQHKVTFAAPFAMGKYEVSVAEFGAFVAATGYETVDRCMEFSKKDSFTISKETSWNSTGFEQAPDEPVVCTSYYDAQAYADWLARKTRQPYRLPSEAEWEYAARADSTTQYYWGTEDAAVCDFANVRSNGAYAISKRQSASDLADGFPCDDGYPHTSPVGSFKPNDFGLYDVQGNAWEWVSDCNHKDYNGAPTDGSPWLDEDKCQFGVIRSGSYINLVQRSTTTVRAGRPRSGGATNMGFRLARGESRAVTDRKATDWIPPDPQTGEGGTAAALWDNNCAACHIERGKLQGIYGKDQESIETVIRDGGNNVMSMPTFGVVLSEAEIVELAAYVREVNGWD